MKNASDNDSHSADDATRAAAAWVLRHDRGLTATEQDEFSQWLAADARNSAAWAATRWGWDELDRLAGLQTSLGAVPDPDLLVAPRAGFGGARRLWWLAPISLAAAAAVLLAVRFAPGSRPAPAPVALGPSPLAAPCEQRTLEDGSVVALNRGAAIDVQFVPGGERRVRLVRGEASFAVAKDATRPFIVSAAGVDVRAVGTAFNVLLGAGSVEVLVTEGRVQVDRPVATTAPAAAPPPAPAFVDAGQHTVVSLAPAAPLPPATTVTPQQTAVLLAWQPRLLDFTDEPLTKIAATFNRHNTVQLEIADTSIGALRLSASFRSDNVQGFVRLMESDFGLRAEWRSPTEVRLARAH